MEYLLFTHRNSTTNLNYTPELSLWLAVLDKALSDLIDLSAKYNDKNAKEPRYLLRLLSVKKWFLSKNSAVGSYQWVIDSATNLNSTYLKNLLRPMLIGNPHEAKEVAEALVERKKLMNRNSRVKHGKPTRALAANQLDINDG